MRYLPDTNTIIAFTRHGDQKVARRLADNRAEIGLSSIVVHELCYGAFLSNRQEHHLATLDDLNMPPLDFTVEDARVAGEIRAILRRAGTPIGPYDVLIAGQALARDLIVLTNNVGEFSRVDGLRIEDWTNT